VFIEFTPQFCHCFLSCCVLLIYVTVNCHVQTQPDDRPRPSHSVSEYVFSSPGPASRREVAESPHVPRSVPLVPDCDGCQILVTGLWPASGLFVQLPYERSRDVVANRSVREDIRGVLRSHPSLEPISSIAFEARHVFAIDAHMDSRVTEVSLHFLGGGALDVRLKDCPACSSQASSWWPRDRVQVWASLATLHPSDGSSVDIATLQRLQQVLGRLCPGLGAPFRFVARYMSGAGPSSRAVIVVGVCPACVGPC
jgi:hypothetical protein